jgi:hypothetical protein
MAAMMLLTMMRLKSERKGLASAMLTGNWSRLSICFFRAKSLRRRSTPGLAYGVAKVDTLYSPLPGWQDLRPVHALTRPSELVQ